MGRELLEHEDDAHRWAQKDFRSQTMLIVSVRFCNHLSRLADRLVVLVLVTHASAATQPLLH